jgi:anaerobic selenocysteine-containing dehydrogenase
MERIRNEDGRVNVYIPELAQWVQNIDAESEASALEGDSQYPLVLNAGLHMDTNANTLMRNPAWNKDRRACTLAMHPEDASALNLSDGQMVRIVTEAGTEEIELEVTPTTRPRLVVIPHGFGLEYNGKVYGANVNRLTQNTNRDKLAGTPLHRYVPCRVEAL